MNDSAPTAEERRDELLSAYLDDELTVVEFAELEARLVTDAALRDSLEGMRQVRDVLATLEVVPAPRSFALTAPPLRERPAGLSRLGLVTRLGAMTASVAFVVVLAGDLSGGGTPVTDQSIAAVLSETSATELSQESGAAGGDTTAAERSADATSPSDSGGEAAAPAPEDDPQAEEAATAASSAADDPTSEPTVTAASAELSATQEPAVEPDSATAANTDASADPAPAASGAVQPSDTGATDADPEDGTPRATTGQPAAPEDAQPADGADTAASDGAAAAASDDDSTRVGGDDAAGTTDAAPALGPQLGAPTAESPETGAADLLIEDDGEVSGLAIALGTVAVALALASGLLWRRRRDGATGPV